MNETTQISGLIFPLSTEAPSSACGEAMGIAPEDIIERVKFDFLRAYLMSGKKRRLERVSMKFSCRSSSINFLARSLSYTPSEIY